jgi:hypothetical protein
MPSRKVNAFAFSLSTRTRTSKGVLTPPDPRGFPSLCFPFLPRTYIHTGPGLPASSDAEAFYRVFHIVNEDATCLVPAPLVAKYNIPVIEADDSDSAAPSSSSSSSSAPSATATPGAAPSSPSSSSPAPSAPAPALSRNSQHVVGISNRYLGEQVWFNMQRTVKPQSFKAEGSVVDPTDNGAKCDFCDWENLTAVDAFGRIERPLAVSASNLFKYGVQHGLILLKQHDPLYFSEEALRDLLLVSAEWFARSARLRPDLTHPLFLWNTLPRSGASQFHPHAQLLLSPGAVPIAQN